MSERNVLLVEGRDDEHVIYSLAVHYTLPPNAFQVKNKDGIDKLLHTLHIELRASDLERLGIIIDADTNLSARWQSIRNTLNNFGYSNLPASPDTEGIIISQIDLPTVGIWFMPNNILPGILEDFVSFLVPPNDVLWQRAKDCVDQIPTEDRRFPPVRQSKAYIHTWLAWQEEPGKPLGQSITSRYLDANAPHAQQLVDWIRRLFDLPPNTIN